jgi:hypothetical protein
VVLKNKKTSLPFANFSKDENVPNYWLWYWYQNNYFVYDNIGKSKLLIVNYTSLPRSGARKR